jgi:CRISPR/Cas system-associated endonuclease/helicase Cas3
MNGVSATKTRREVALTNLKEHVKKDHEQKEKERHLDEIKALEDRIKTGAKFRKYLKRKPTVRQNQTTNEAKGD